jgi:hypothetical protein
LIKLRLNLHFPAIISSPKIKICRTIRSGTQKPIPKVGKYRLYKRVVMFRWVVGKYRLYKMVVMFRWVVGKYRLYKRVVMFRWVVGKYRL